jgi:rRNA-processing protein Efg1
MLRRIGASLFCTYTLIPVFATSTICKFQDHDKLPDLLTRSRLSRGVKVGFPFNSRFCFFMAKTISAPSNHNQDAHNAKLAPKHTPKDKKDKAKKHYKPNPLAKAHPKKLTPSSSALSKRIRDAKRLAAKSDSAMKVELLRKVEGLERELLLLKRDEREKKIRETYKYVRFVERKKVVRRLKAATEAGEVEALQRMVSN